MKFSHSCSEQIKLLNNVVVLNDLKEAEIHWFISNTCFSKR